MPKRIALAEFLGKKGQESNSRRGRVTTPSNTPPNGVGDKDNKTDKFGLFLLNKQTSPTYNVDIIAIHGLGGSAYKTWTHDNGTLWLRDFLPEDLPGARVFTYGYDSAFVFSRTTSTLRDYARALLEDIRSERTLPEEEFRPLIFVCHSMGGLVIKQALIIARNEPNFYSNLSASTYAVLFLGTPHQGSPAAASAKILSQVSNMLVVGSQISRFTGSMRSELLGSLETNEKDLLHIAQDFRTHAGNMQITSFIEQKIVPGLDERIVDDKSGFVGAATERIVPMVDCDHREICKPGEKASNYKKIKNAIIDGTRLANTNTPTTQARDAAPFAETLIHINIPQKVFHYVDRKILLESVLQPIMDDSSTRIVLLGMGGSGKTQLALDICHQIEQSNRFMAVIWIDASSPASVIQGYELIAKKLFKDQPSCTDSEANISSIQDALHDWPRPWLMVFDNFDDPSAFQKRAIQFYIPAGRNGRIIFTSRHADTAQLGQCIPVSGMSEEESVRLLLQRTPWTDEERIHGIEVATILGHHALALDQAGAYIRARHLPLREFKTQYKQRKDKILKEAPEVWYYRRKLRNMEEETNLTVLTTCELSFEQIKDGFKETADHFLTLAAFLNPHSISERYFRSYYRRMKPTWMGIFSSANKWDSCKLEDFLVDLDKLSLLHLCDSQSGSLQFSLHPIIRDWARLRKERKAQQRFTMEAASMLASFIRSKGSTALPLNVNLETALHINSCLQDERDLSADLPSSNLNGHPKKLYKFAEFYTDQGQYEIAESLLDRVLAIKEGQPGFDQAVTWDAMHELAYIYGRQARYNEVERILNLRQVVGKHVLGFKDISASCLMANVYTDQHRFDEAERLYKQLLAQSEEQLGSEHLGVPTILAGLGGLYRMQNRLQEAENATERCLATQVKLHGHTHLDTLLAMNNLANIYNLRGRKEDANKLYNQALTCSEERRGVDHPNTLMIVYNLALLYWNEGRFREAEQLYERALAGKERRLGSKHPFTVKTAECLAYVYEKTGRHNEVAELRQRYNLPLKIDLSPCTTEVESTSVP